MNIFAFEATLKHAREEQERAAERALLAHRARSARANAERKRSLRLAESLGVLLPRRTSPR